VSSTDHAEAVRSLCAGRTLIALCGAPASGKTTLADECDDLATVVSIDRIRSTGRGGGLDPYGPKATRRAFNTAYAVVDQALKQDQPAVLDSTASSKQARASILRLAAKHDAACHLVVLDEPLETLLERNAARGDTCPDEVLRKLHETLSAGLEGIGAEGFESVHICSAGRPAHLLHSTSAGGVGRSFGPAGRCDPAPSQISLPARKSGRAGTSRRGYGARHQALRKQLAPLVAEGGVACARCGEPIAAGTPWDLGHDDHDRSIYTGPEHAGCNRATAGRNGLGNQSRRW